MPKLHLSSFEKALDAFRRSIQVSKTYLTDDHSSTDLKDTLRAGVIQHFEFCYELSWKMLKRQLEMDAATPEVIDALSYPALIREGAEKQWIVDGAKWLYYRHQRNLTSHTYDETAAIQIYNAALEFYQDARHLLDRLQANNT